MLICCIISKLADEKARRRNLRAAVAFMGLAASMDRHDQGATVVEAGDHPDDKRYDTTRRFTTAIAKVSSYNLDTSSQPFLSPCDNLPATNNRPTINYRRTSRSANNAVDAFLPLPKQVGVSSSRH